ncbi:hypothetical protein PIB30_054681 [Stylosanthes scabra]|uniref:Uncharacterized protein n=1 Tax=Stylosanthes scabra TaxID=79078 RepID=A0ABU6TIL1_9FABA|nr:hypothetical protein [Stylosanthes scabra]
MEDTHHNTAVADGSIDDPPKDAIIAMEVDELPSIEEETNTTQQHVVSEKHVEEYVASPQQEALVQELTLRDFLEIEKGDPKQDVAAADSELDFAQPSFDLGIDYASQCQPQETEIYDIDDEEDKYKLLSAKN